MPNISVEDTKGGRYYLIDGQKYISVTTPFSLLSVPHLAVWRARIGNTQANKISEKAANYGSVMHKYCADLCEGKEIVVKKAYIENVDVMRAWIAENVEEVTFVEQVVYSETFLIAGRYDLLGKIKGLDGLTIVDWKTGRIKPEHFLQLAAYKYLTCECMPEIRPEDIKHRLVVSIKEGKVKAIPPDKSNPKDDTNLGVDWEVYKNLVSVYHWFRKGK